MRSMPGFLKRPTGVALCGAIATFGSAAVQAQEDKPNILVIWGDDIGRSNISAYTFGLMGYQTPTIAGLLKAQGYASGQFGKNHLGDKNEHLPTNHGFDAFFGNLYHLNAEEEPENEDYPGDMVLPSCKTFREQYGPRGVLRSETTADGGQQT